MGWLSHYGAACCNSRGADQVREPLPHLSDKSLRDLEICIHGLNSRGVDLLDLCDFGFVHRRLGFHIVAVRRVIYREHGILVPFALVDVVRGLVVQTGRFAVELKRRITPSQNSEEDLSDYGLPKLGKEAEGNHVKG